MLKKLSCMAVCRSTVCKKKNFRNNLDDQQWRTVKQIMTHAKNEILCGH